MSTSFILILLFASLHACNANSMINRKFVLPYTKPPKNVEEMKSQSKAAEARLLKEGYGYTKSTAPALSVEQEEFKVLLRVEGREETPLGNMVTRRSLVRHHEVGLKVQAMLERISRKSSGPSTSSEDNKDEITEDVAIMDYSHAQRKPPIHN